MDDSYSKYSKESLVDSGYINIDNQTSCIEESQPYIAEYRAPEIITSYAVNNQFNIFSAYDKSRETEISSDIFFNFNTVYNSSDTKEDKSVTKITADTQSLHDFTSTFEYRAVDNGRDEGVLMDVYERDNDKQELINKNSEDPQLIIPSSFSIDVDNNILKEDTTVLELDDAILSSKSEDLLVSDVIVPKVEVEKESSESIPSPPQFRRKDKSKPVIENITKKDAILENKSPSTNKMPNSKVFINTDNEIPFCIDKSGAYISKSTRQELTLTEAIDSLEADGFRYTSPKEVVFVIIVFFLSAPWLFFSIALIVYGIILLRSSTITYSKKVDKDKTIRISMYLDEYRKEMLKAKGYIYIGIGIFSIILFHMIF